MLLNWRIQRRPWTRLVLLDWGGGGGVFSVIGPEAGDFEEHAEEGEDARGFGVSDWIRQYQVEDEREGIG
jgi:hypothetical protein